MPSKRLGGQGIVVTRPAEQAGNLVALIEAAGGRALRFPCVEIADPPDPEALRQVAERLDRFDIAVFISPTAVDRAFLAIRDWPRRLCAAAVGPGTRRALERHGIGAVISPLAGADSEALLAESELRAVSGKRILIVRGGAGRELLGDTLAGRGAKIEYLQAYQRVRPDTDIAPLIDGWSRGAVQAVTVFSRGALKNLAAMLGQAAGPMLEQTPVFASHARIAGEASKLGAGSVKLAGPGDEEMLAGLVSYLNAGR